MAKKGTEVVQTQPVMSVLERAVAVGDLATMTTEERGAYYGELCRSLGLNPLTRPFEYLVLDNKLTLYARKDCAEQLRKLNVVSVTILAREIANDVCTVHARATLPDGRTDESIGAVAMVKDDGEWVESRPGGKRYFRKNGKIIPLVGTDYANAIMKAETKAKRRVTLSICGLGFLDETEVESIRDAEFAPEIGGNARVVVNQQRPALPAPAQPTATGTGSKASQAKAIVMDGLVKRLRDAASEADIAAVCKEANAARRGGLISDEHFDGLKAVAAQERQRLAQDDLSVSDREEQVAALLAKKDARWHAVLESCGVKGDNPDEMSQEEFDACVTYLEAMPDAVAA